MRMLQPHRDTMTPQTYHRKTDCSVKVIGQASHDAAANPKRYAKHTQLLRHGTEHGAQHHSRAQHPQRPSTGAPPMSPQP